MTPHPRQLLLDGRTHYPERWGGYVPQREGA